LESFQIFVLRLIPTSDLLSVLLYDGTY
jgi:hypothetical protein